MDFDCPWHCMPSSRHVPPVLQPIPSYAHAHSSSYGYAESSLHAYASSSLFSHAHVNSSGGSSLRALAGLSSSLGTQVSSSSFLHVHVYLSSSLHIHAHSLSSSSFHVHAGSLSSSHGPSHASVCSTTYLYDCLNQYLPLTDLCPLFLFMYNTLLSACTDISLSIMPWAMYQKYDVNIVYMRNEVAGQVVN